MNPYFFESCMKRAGVKRSDVKKLGVLQILFSWFVRVVLYLEIDLLSIYNPRGAIHFASASLNGQR
jgi:hypothetical protein